MPVPCTCPPLCLHYRQVKAAASDEFVYTFGGSCGILPHPLNVIPAMCPSIPCEMCLLSVTGTLFVTGSSLLFSMNASASLTIEQYHNLSAKNRTSSIWVIPRYGNMNSACFYDNSGNNEKNKMLLSA